MEQDIKIFSFCHDKNSLEILIRNIKRQENCGLYQPVLCGGYPLNGNNDIPLKDSISVKILKDDSGENISQYNRYFNEITGMFWLFKNYELPEYVGISHYRRIIPCSGEMLAKLDAGTIFTFEGTDFDWCDHTYDQWQQNWDVGKRMNLNKDVRILNYENEDVYPKNIKELILPYVRQHSKGVQYKYLSVMPKKVFVAMMEFYEPIIKHYIEVIDSGKYKNIRREFGFVLEYLYSHFVNIYSRMFDYKIDRTYKFLWMK